MAAGAAYIPRMAAGRRARGERDPDHAPAPEALERELASVRGALQAKGAIKHKSLKGWLLQRLEAEGYERSGAWLRRPAHEQILAALSRAESTTVAELQRLVQGVPRPELARLLVELEQRGEVRRVQRGASSAFSSASTAVLSLESLRTLSSVVSRLGKALAVATRKRGTTLLESDVAAALAEAGSVLGSDAPVRASAALPERELAPSASLASKASQPSRTSVLAALDATRDLQTGLSFVPRLVQRLLSDVSLAVAHEMLLGAARDELIELRPEGGLGRLTQEELGLCPPGPGGTRLSWARPLCGSAPT
jgi:hypothetical protein